MVAFGHTLRGGAGHQAVYAFHVPAFFFLAGMTYRRETPIGTQLKKDARSLLIPYAVFGLISILIYALLGKIADSFARFLESVFLQWHPAFKKA